MKYVRFVVITADGRTVELARSYRNSVQVIPQLPFMMVLKDNSEARSVSASWCTKDEKYRIWRRCDHAGYEPLVDRLEELWMRK